MNKALEKERGFLPSNTKTTEVLQPGNGALHLPTPAVTTQWACILCDILRPAIAPMGSDHFYLETLFFLNAQTGHIHEFFENTGLRPSAKPAVGGALGAQLAGKILPLGPIIQDPEDRL